MPLYLTSPEPPLLHSLCMRVGFPLGIQIELCFPSFILFSFLISSQKLAVLFFVVRSSVGLTFAFYSLPPALPSHRLSTPMSSTLRNVGPPVTVTAGPGTTAHAVAPRKRRRRAPASGAADDCFACRKRHMKCDRRRPYCTQCLDQGKDCSGYKTQLTWGVGVASRGKLRGQALPILQQKAKPSPAVGVKRARRSFSSAADSVELSRSSSQRSTDEPRTQQVETKTVTAAVTNYDFVNTEPTPTAGIPAPQLQNLYQTPASYQWMESACAQGETLFAQRRPLQTLLQLHTPLASSYEDYGLPRSASSVSCFSESDVGSPLDFPHTPEDTSFLYPPLPVYDALPSQHGIPIGGPCVMADQRAPTSFPDQYLSGGSLSSSVSSTLSSMDGRFDLGDYHKLPSSPLGPCNISDILFDDDIPGVTGSSTDDIELGFGCGSHVVHLVPEILADDLSGCPTATKSSTKTSSIPRTIPSSSASNPLRRTSSLVQHFDRVICPSLVSRDSIHNPYRSQLLPLAESSECLLNAIAALSASSLRRKRVMSAKSRSHGSIVDRPPLSEDLNEIFSNHGADIDRSGWPWGQQDLSERGESQETLFLKDLAVKKLNDLLCDPSQATQDPVLATLLILCLYHACQTGVAQFETQFAGVKKLLELRQARSETKKTSWMRLLFTFLDAMIATTNDREAQLYGSCLDVSDESEDKAILEMLTGCHGGLFDIVAKLGRLNLLSQKRPVRNDHISPKVSGFVVLSSSCSALSSLSNSSGLAGQAARDYYSMKNAIPENQRWPYNVFHNKFNRCDMDEPCGLFTNDEEHDEDNQGDGEDGRAEFWKEWRRIRQCLREWKSVGCSSIHVSEAFRHAALLYSERLASPHLSSAQPRFQNLVTRILFHIDSIPSSSSSSSSGSSSNSSSSSSDGFILWPLFIAGTECVDRAQRTLIRHRCREMHGRNGFVNALSTLRVLKKIWRTDDDLVVIGGGHRHEDPKASDGGKAFKWRRWFEQVDGEFFIV